MNRDLGTSRVDVGVAPIKQGGGASSKSGEVKGHEIPTVLDFMQSKSSLYHKINHIQRLAIIKFSRIGTGPI